MRRLSSNEIRNEFLNYFKERGHEIYPSDNIVPSNDPTLLFTTAGMVQFKPLWAGAPLKSPRAASVQKCLRAGGKGSDLENVGRTLRHHTFFEMLGNFSFGDYFKEEAVSWAWDFAVNVLEIPKEKLWVSVFEDDDEAEEIWGKHIKKERIVRLGPDDNFWGPAGPSGACGPCSEIYIDLGHEKGCQKPGCAVGCDCERYLEFWNIVFPQFFQDENGARSPLKRRGIDTGMGLERLAYILQGAQSNYDTDLFRPIIDEIIKISDGRIDYPGNESHKVSVHVIADHVRAITFALAENILPSNEGRGYVVRRILRRAARHARMLGIEDVILSKLAPIVIEKMKDAYPDLAESREHVCGVILAEEKGFAGTLSSGINALEDLLAGLRKNNEKILPGKDVFYLYDTLGFPVDLVRDILDDEGFTFSEDEFEGLMAAQKRQARAGWQGGEDASLQDVYKEMGNSLEPVEFVGYRTEEISSKIVALIVGAQNVQKATAGEKVCVVLEKTPFYAQAGGQVGDTGVIQSSEGCIRVQNTTAFANKLIFHYGIVESGEFACGYSVRAKVNGERRAKIMAHHTATHILQAALQEKIDKNIKQAGSYVGPDHLRFDFSHYNALTAAQIRQVEDLVNEKICRDDPVKDEVLSIKEAKKQGAMALFGEKYADEVRVISVGDFSKELCGGLHVNKTGDIKTFKINSERSVSSGVRRIEAVAGRAAVEKIKKAKQDIARLAGLLGGLPLSPAKIDDYDAFLKKKEPQIDKYTQDKVETEKKIAGELLGFSGLGIHPDVIDNRLGEVLKELLELYKQREKKIEAEDMGSLEAYAEALCSRIREKEGVSFIASRIDKNDIEQIRTLIDIIKKKLQSGIVVLASVMNGKAVIVAGVTEELVKKGYHAGKIVGKLAGLVGGRGGGRPDFAQAGGPEVDKLDKAIEFVENILKVNH